MSQIQFTDDELIMLSKYYDSIKYGESENTDNNNSNHLVASLLDRFGGDIDKLKSYVKWLYKYGGTGSRGGGSGSGSGSTKWSLSVSLNDQYITKSITPVEKTQSNKYVVTLKINRPGSDTYSVQVMFRPNGQENFTKYNAKTLSAENNNVSLTISLPSNGLLMVNASNNFSDDDPVSIQTTCIFEPATISLALADETNKVINVQNETLYYNTINKVDKGIQLKIDHEIFLEDANNININVDINGNIDKTINIDNLEKYAKTQDGLNYSFINLYDILDFENSSEDDIAGTYYINASLNYNYQGQQKSILAQYTITIIPSGLYLKIVPKLQGASIYKNPQTDNMYLFNSSYINLILTAYSDINENLTVRIYNNNGDRVNNSSFKNKQSITLSLSCASSLTEITENYFTFEISSATNGVKQFVYYMYINKEEGQLLWYTQEVQNAIINEAYFRSGNDADIKNINKNILLGLNDNFSSSGYVTLNVANDIIDEGDERGGVVLFNGIRNMNLCDMIISVGLQYNIVNDDSKILSFIFGSGNATKQLDIYQNRIIYNKSTNNALEIFLPPESIFNAATHSKYHLLNILVKKITGVYNESNEELPVYELVVFIDGTIEQILSTYFIGPSDLTESPDTYALTQVNAYEGNYSINLFDVCYLNNSTNDINSTAGLNLDLSIAQYYKKYQSYKMSSENMQSNMTEDLENFKIFVNTIAPKFKEEDIDSGSAKSTFISIDLSNAQTLDEDTIKSQLLGGDKDYNWGVPILIVNFDITKTQTAINNFLVNEFSTQYKEGELSKTKTSVSQLIWIDENNNIQTINREFEFSLQGSSTGQFKSKNFNLTAKNNNTGFRTLWTPNFSTSKTEKTTYNEDINLTFLPENTFTFKADAVDSTHSNNTSIGEFVNMNTKKFAYANSGVATQYKPYIKNCLTGFKVLVIFTFTITDESSSYVKAYFMGIYNFNLGRDSYLNLGYYNLNNIFGGLKDMNGNLVDIFDGQHNGFGLYQIEDELCQPISGLSVAEIQGGQNYFDFSQFDGSILFGSGIDTEMMFGDFYPTTDVSKQYGQNKIATFVESVAIFGGGLFKKLKKNMSTDPSTNYGYEQGYNAFRKVGSTEYLLESINQVPNYLYQFEAYKSTTSTDNVVEFRCKDAQLQLTDEMNPDNTAFGNAFYSFIGIPNEEVSEGEDTQVYYNQASTNSRYTYLLDYNSLVEYFTICMAFGLVDSVMKNLNIKSFGEHSPYYIGFYDMDTANSRDNGGKYTSPFAFTDYWTTNDNNENVIYRDFYPDPGKTKGYVDRGYDIPSSYLFAIAKYAKYFYQEYSDGYYDTNPNYYWYKMRATASSPLANSEKFVNEYFAKDSNHINNIVWNLNYRFKYFKKGLTAYDSTNTDPFHGRGIACFKDWLSKRLHILDAYFNIMQIDQPIQWYNTETSPNKWENIMIGDKQLYAPSFQVISNRENLKPNNNDIQLEQSILTELEGEGMGKYTGTSVYLNVKALDYSPMYFSVASIPYSFICTDKSKTYTFSASRIVNGGQGQISMKFGGSVAWTWVDKFDTFIEGGILRLTTDYLENINVTSGVLTNLQLAKIKAVKEINITSKDASCDVLLTNANDEDNYPNLKTVNLSNSSCGLTIRNVNVTTINYKDVNAPNKDVEITDCKKIINAEFTNSKFRSLTCTNMWKGKSQKINNFGLAVSKKNIRVIEFVNTNIETITLQNQQHEDLAIIIRNDDTNTTLRKLTLSGFSYVYIDNCSNLKEIIITDDESLNLKLKSLVIKNCYPRASYDGSQLAYTDTNKITLKTHKHNRQEGEQNIVESDLSTPNLSQFSALDSISFEETWFVNKVTLPAKNITLIDKAFYKTSLEYIDFASDDIFTLYLEQTGNADAGIFEDSHFRLSTSNSSLLDYALAPECTSLSRMFLVNTQVNSKSIHKAESNVTYNSCMRFLKQLDNREVVTDMSYMFYNQQNIICRLNQNENGGLQLTTNDGPMSASALEDLRLELGAYVNVNDISHMFEKTNMMYFNKSSFSLNGHVLGENNNSINIYNFIVPLINDDPSEIIYMSEDALDPLYNKIDTFFINSGPRNNESIKYQYSLGIVESDSIILKENVNLRRLFVPETETTFPAKLTKLVGFNIINPTVTIDGFITETDNAKISNILYCLNNFNNISALDGNDDINIGLNHLKELTLLYKSFNITSNINNRINIKNFIDISKLDKLKANIVSFAGTDVTNTLFNFYKKFDMADWEETWNVLHTQKNIDYFFSKCEFISVDETPVEINIPAASETSQITSARYLFAETTAINNVNSNVGIVISSINELDNVTTLVGMFNMANINNANQYPIVANLFDGMNKLTNVSSMFKSITFTEANGIRTYRNGEAKECYYKHMRGDITIEFDNSLRKNPHNYQLFDSLYSTYNTDNISLSDLSDKNNYYPILPETLFVNSSITNVSSFIENSPLEGYLPSMFTGTSVTNINNFIYNCKVLPQLRGTYTTLTNNDVYNVNAGEQVLAYVFLPDNYLTNVISSANGLCSFKLLTLLDDRHNGDTSENKQRLYLMTNSIISNINTSLFITNASPVIDYGENMSSTYKEESLITNCFVLNPENHDTFTVNYFNTNEAINAAGTKLISIINACANINNTNISEGFDLTNITFNNFINRTELLLNPLMASIYYGYLYKSGTLFTKTTAQQTLEIFQRIDGPNKQNIALGLSAFIVLPRIDIIYRTAQEDMSFDNENKRLGLFGVLADFVPQAQRALINTAYSTPTPCIRLNNSTPININIDNIDNIPSNITTKINTISASNHSYVDEDKPYIEHQNIILNYLLLFNDWLRRETGKFDENGEKQCSLETRTKLSIFNNGYPVAAKGESGTVIDLVYYYKLTESGQIIMTQG